MSHRLTHVPRMQRPALFLRQIVSDIDLGWNVSKLDFLLGPPLLDGECLNLHMLGTRGGVRVVDNIGHSLLVLMQHRGAILNKTEFVENGS